MYLKKQEGKNYLLSKQDENLAKLLEILEVRTFNKNKEKLTNTLSTLVYKCFRNFYEKKNLIVLMAF